MCQWVIESWREVPSDMVIRFFLKCGISNSVDGTQDDELFSDFVRGPQEAASCDDVCVDEDSDDDDEWVYDENVTSEQFQELFGESDEEDFDGF